MNVDVRGRRSRRGPAVVGTLALVGCVFLSIGTAAAAPATLQDCRGIADAAQRLACFDKLVGAPAVNGVPAVGGTATRSAPPAPMPAPVTPEQAFGAETVQKPQAAQEEERGLESLKTTVVSVKEYRPGRLLIQLANGQSWRQTETQPLNLGKGDAVEIRRGVLGSYNLYPNSLNHVFKVERVK